MRAIVAILIPFTILGCYEYVPLEGAPPPRHELVRATLTDVGATELAPRVGPRVAAVEGFIADGANGADTARTALTFSVARTVTRSGEERGWNGEQVTIPRSAIATFQLRRLSRPRSIALGAILAGVVALGARTLGDLGGGGQTGRPRPVPQ
jgi:hypothetical protein